MKYLLKRYLSFSSSLFFYSGAILFSFAPYLSLKSLFTKLILYFLYAIFFGSFLLFCFSTKFYRSRIKNVILLFLMILVYSGLGILKAGISAFMSSSTNFIIPIIICSILYLSNISINVNLNYILEKFLIILSICVLINCVYSIYTVITNDGTLTNLYVYKTIDGNEYNYFRYGRLRAFGFLHNAVTYSNYLSIFVILYLNRIKLRKHFFIRAFILILVLISLYLTGSRTPILSSFLAFSLLRFFDKKRQFIPFLSLVSIAFILILLSVTGKGDLSALGRITQYVEAFNLFVGNPFGYGIGYAGYPKGIVSFDCAILVLLVNFGIFGFFYLMHIYKKNINNRKVDAKNFLSNGLIINLFILSGFANVIHLGFLSLTFMIYFLTEERNEKNISCSYI